MGILNHHPIKSVALHPFFLLGLTIRVALIFSMAPSAVSAWYVPFLDTTTATITLDPWSIWLESGGSPAAFPYGYGMWLAFVPIILGAKAVGLPLEYAYSFTLLLADIVLLAIITKLLPDRRKLVLILYWLSPIVILSSYILGLNDLIPSLLLTLSILFLRRLQLVTSGVLLAAAISAKFSMIVTLPFFVIYLYNNKALRQQFFQFTTGFFIAALIFGIPFLLSGPGLEMLFGNPEMGKIYHLALQLGNNIAVYLVPLIYLVLVYLTWRVRRLNFDLYLATTGMALLLIVLMTPASPGWFVWCLPFLVLYQSISGSLAILLVSVFSGLYVVGTLIATPIRLIHGVEINLSEWLNLPIQVDSHTSSLLQTAMVAIGIILAIRIWRETISRNDFFRISRKPFVIGISGDSGSGKDTLSDAISGLFGGHSVVTLSGDNYHLWDRQKPMWQVMTHLNPMANDLESFCNDLVSLTDGKTIFSRHYDHGTGRMGKPLKIKSNDFVIASGLHALYLPILRDCYNLKIFLDIDENLRRHLKIMRDVEERGHSLEKVIKSFEKRKADSERFIHPQSRHADLILSLQPIHPRILDGADSKSTLRLKLSVKTRQGFNELSLNRVLVGICGLHVDISTIGDGSEVEMTIEGETSAADIEMAARILCPRVLDLLDLQPRWLDGVIGLMQLVTLSHISQALTKRFI